MRERRSRLDQDVFVGESQSLADHDPLTMEHPFDDSFGNGPSLHRATFHGTLAEWSLDALGWLGGFLADLVRVPYADHMLVPLPAGVSPEAGASASILIWLGLAFGLETAIGR